MKILGISALYHDSAAVLLEDDRIVAAAQEERFSRIKQDRAMPARAIEFCLKTGGITAAELDAVCYYDNPLLTLDRWLKNCVAESGSADRIIGRSFDDMFSNRLWIRRRVSEVLGGWNGKFLVCEHHVSHAASAFYPSPFEGAAVVTVDGVGEWGTTTIGLGSGAEVRLLRQLNYPHSLGMLYSAMTYFCGFKVNSGEYKLMGLAPYGKPIYRDRIMERLIEVKPDGSFRLHTDLFAFPRDTVMTGEAFEQLFGGARRLPESRISQREMDLAASVQQVTEEVMVRLCRTARELTGERNLCLAGGIALNCVANGRILREKLFDRLWIQPAAGDAGGALGCALYAYYRLSGRGRRPERSDSQQGSLLGPAYSGAEVREFLKARGLRFQEEPDPEKLAARVAGLLAQEKAVGICRGRMEYGPRSLGNRSIIASPLSAETQSRLNLKIKFRESFRPFAPAVLAERAADYFELAAESPYMLLVAPVRPELRCEFDLPRALAENEGDLLAAVNQPRSTIPAVTHVDYTARVQTVDRERNPFFHSLIREFEALTGCAVVVNTSFNVRGEPIVCTPEDAWRCFMRTGLDVLVLEDCLLFKEEQQPLENDSDWMAQYELD